MKLLIVGSRSITDYDISPHIPAETELIISGGANGVDTLAEKYADKHRMILSIIVGTFSSNIHTLMRSYLRNYSIAASLPWEEARHWKYISACCSNS